jgi:hypothetical protein
VLDLISQGILLFFTIAFFAWSKAAFAVFVQEGEAFHLTVALITLICACAAGTWWLHLTFGP